MGEFEKNVEAELLRQSHCGRKGMEHTCVGEVKINRMGMELNCLICGVDSHNLEAIQILRDDAIAILKAAGIEFNSLELTQKINVLREILACKGG